MNPDEPVGPQLDPNLNGPGKPGYCYCCCSCFATNTPIEVSPGEFALAGDIEREDLILTAGTDLNWVQKPVASASVWNPKGGSVHAMYFVRYEYADGEEASREIIVSPDHLFLMEDGKLLAVQHLKKTTLKLRRADGRLAVVTVVARGTFKGGVASLQMGDFDGRDLNGHLLNSNGIVSADFAVQAYYAASGIDPTLLVSLTAEQEAMEIGTEAYHALHPDSGYSTFVANPDQWPAGFLPLRRREITPPPGAYSFFTPAQATDIRRRAPKGSLSNTYPARSLLYLFNVASGFYGSTTFLLDWDNEEPNAYAWTEWGKPIVVITGGLVRVQAMRRDGLSLVLSAMISYASQSISCVGEADYAAVGFVMHNLWEDNLYVTVVEQALPQVEAVFDFISAENQKGDPADPCRKPGIPCRRMAYHEALRLYPLPECAKPKPNFFELIDATANTVSEVVIAFNRDLDAASAQSMLNYEFDPPATMVSACLVPASPRQVVLTVEPLAPTTTYVVKVSSLVSNDGVKLDPAHSTGAFITP